MFNHLGIVISISNLKILEITFPILEFSNLSKFYDKKKKKKKFTVDDSLISDKEISKSADRERKVASSASPIPRARRF